MKREMFESLDLESFPRGETGQFWIQLVVDGAGRSMGIPVMVARGRRSGPTVGVTAAVHGNELNGIPIIHRLFRSIESDELKGTIVAVPIVNLPGYLNHEREFIDGEDLNRLFPGKADGNVSEVYAARFIDRIVSKFNYLIDLHTASFGRVNALYVRADMNRPIVAKMSRLISPQIIVHNEGADGTLRAAADDMDIPAITVEVGDPQRFQRGFIRSSRLGIQAVLDHLDMYDHNGSDAQEDDTIECQSSHWVYTDTGGILVVDVGVADRVKKDQRIATITDLFGDVVREYCAEQDSVVVGKSTNPVAQTGSRIVHLGIER